MRLLILGGDGMLGHALLREWRARHDVFVTLRSDGAAYRHLGLFRDEETITGVDARNLQDVVSAIVQARPEVIVNAVGLVKQRAIAKDSLPSIEVNALLPHRLAEVARLAGIRVVQLSTDCVFSGAKGSYREDDVPDAYDLYGRTKLLGELHEPHCVTLRTSIIGLELARKKSLVEWFIAQKGQIRGYRRAIYSGLTTREMARAIESILTVNPALSGVWHLSSEPITKFDLLSRLAARLHRNDVDVVPDDDFACDRSLDSTALQGRTTYRVPGWEKMLDELASEIQLRERSHSHAGLGERNP